MADTKISALPASSTPLAGTEVLPIVQAGATKQVSVADLTAGRAVGVQSLTVASANPRINFTPTTPFTGYCLTDYSSGGGSFYIGTDNSTGSALGTSAYARLLWGVGAYPVVIATNNTARVTVAGAGDITLNTGNLVIGTSGKGIDFSATSGTGTSELLNDYEEGTWTPTWNGGSVTINNTCYYTKIGRQVTVTADITFGTSASASDSALTLPFTGLGPWGGGSVNYTDISATASVNVQASAGTVNFRSAINGGNLSCSSTASKRVVFIASYFTS